MSLAEEKQKVKKKQKQVESKIFLSFETIKKAKRHNNRIIPSCENIFLAFQQREMLEQRLSFLENIEDESSTYPLEIVVSIIKQVISAVEDRNFEFYSYEITPGIYNYCLRDSTANKDNPNFDLFEDEIIVLSTTSESQNVEVNLNELTKTMDDNNHFLYLKKFVELIINTCYLSQKEKLSEEELINLTNTYCQNKKNKRLVRKLD